jgi:uncharacterized protein YlxW (UPF0749 family)
LTPLRWIPRLVPSSRPEEFKPVCVAPEDQHFRCAPGSISIPRISAFPNTIFQPREAMAVTPSKDYKRRAREQRKLEKAMARQAAKAEKLAAKRAAQEAEELAAAEEEAKKQAAEEQARIEAEFEAELKAEAEAKAKAEG